MRRRAIHAVILIAGLLLTSTLAAGLLGAPVPGIGDQEEPAPASQTGATAPQGQAPGGHTHEHAGAPANATGNQTGEASSDDGLRVIDGWDQVKAVHPVHDHALSGGEGQIPTRAEASELPHQLSSFRVVGDDGLTEMVEDGYINGAGTLEDPYVIDGFRVRGDLTVKDTTQPLVIKNSYIEGQLTLNYVGPEIYVHHNHIFDLRVNENVDRRADTSAGLFEHNEIEVIGQLRHFGGTFRDNHVGPRPDDGVVETFLSDTGPEPLPDDLVWNFDGYHRGHVHNNTVIGRVDVKLHGHFHGDCNACPNHDHADPGQFPEDNQRAEGMDPGSRHSYRFHTLAFEDNTITAKATGIALRFYDQDHAGDDQTANSEPNAYLEDLHEHHTYLRITGNELRGGSLVLDVVNPADDRHMGHVSEALVDLKRNEVTLPVPGEGERAPAYTLRGAEIVTLNAQGNTYSFERDSSPMPSGYKWTTRGDEGTATGFLFEDVEFSDVLLTGTQGENADHGIIIDNQREGLAIDARDNDFGADREDRHEQ